MTRQSVLPMAGFTLVELLIAMVLASLLTMLTYSGLQLGLQGWIISERRLLQMENHYLGQALLRRVLESPLRRTLRDEAGRQQIGFYGTEHGLIFTANLPRIADSGTLFWVQLTQVEFDETQPPTWQLVLRYLPFDNELELNWQLLEQTLADTGQQEVVLDGLDAPLIFEYFGQLPDREPDWHSLWQEQVLLPSLVRVNTDEEEAGMLIRVSVAPREQAYAVKVLD